MSARNPAYDMPVEPVASLQSRDKPVEEMAVDRDGAHDEEVDMELAPLLHAEMQKVHGRTRCQTCSIVTQTVLLVAIGLVIIAGVVVLNFQFERLNTNIESLAVTGELARPLLKDGASLANNFNNLTGTLTTDLGITGNNSVASGVRDFANQISDAGRQLFSGLTGAIENAGGGASEPEQTPPPPPDAINSTTTTSSSSLAPTVTVGSGAPPITG